MSSPSEIAQYTLDAAGIALLLAPCFYAIHKFRNFRKTSSIAAPPHPTHERYRPQRVPSHQALKEFSELPDFLGQTDPNPVGPWESIPGTDLKIASFRTNVYTPGLLGSTGDLLASAAEAAHRGGNSFETSLGYLSSLIKAMDSTARRFQTPRVDVLIVKESDVHTAGFLVTPSDPIDL